jgi:hypothetical protein
MSNRVRHETTDISVPGVLGFGGVLIAGGLVISLLVWTLLQFLSSGPASPAAPEFPLARSQAQRLPPEPRLQTDPRGDLLKLRQQDDRLLNSYGWIDRDAGVVRIPIERAMALTAARGLPSRPAEARR